KSRIIEAEILVDLGDHTSAERAARHALELGKDSSALRAGALAALASALGALGRANEAHQAASEAARLLDAGEPLEEGEATVRLVFAEALWRIGKTDAAREAIAAAREKLLQRASTLDEPDRRALLERVPVHARTLARAAEWKAAERSAS